MTDMSAGVFRSPRRTETKSQSAHPGVCSVGAHTSDRLFEPWDRCVGAFVGLEGGAVLGSESSICIATGTRAYFRFRSSETSLLYSQGYSMG